MRDALGGSLLLNLVVFFTTIVILFFVGIIAYSKAYKIKNRIIEVIERHEAYNDVVVLELDEDLRTAGYTVATKDKTSKMCGTNNLNKTDYFYCVYEEVNSNGSKIYRVVTYTHFEFPLIGDILVIPVKGETKILGKNYNY